MIARTWTLAATLLGLGLFACGATEPDNSTTTQPVDARAGESCASGAFETCDVDGESGVRECVASSWERCAAFGTCRPDDPAPLCDDGEEHGTCKIANGQWSVDLGDCPPPKEGGSSTPLVLSFDRAPVVFTHPAGGFDVVGRGASVDTDWVSSATPWLAIDLDGNGRVDDGAELFGSMTMLPNGRRAEQGFQALAALDADGDGRITRKDPAFATILTWRDRNQDRRSDAGETTTLEAEGVIAIDLGFHRDLRCVGTACEVERASFEFRGEHGVVHGDVVDVHFSH
jgi:hypothetical protein